MTVHTVIGVILVVWTAQAGRSAAQQQQPAALAIADEAYSYIARAVHRELQPIVSKLESRVESLDKVVSRLGSRLESLDNRVALLDSRVSTLTAHVLTNTLGEQMEEMSSQLSGITARLDSQQSQLSELNTQLNEQKSQQEETAATVNNRTAQMDIIVKQQGDQLAQTSQLARRLDSQESQLNELNVQLNEQKTTQSELSIRVDNLDNLTSQVDILGYKLTEAINNTSSQQERIGDLAATVNHHHPPRDCSDLPVDSPSGVYLLRPSDGSQQPPVQAYCDMETDGGRWTVIQRRDNIKPHQDFYLRWKEYKEGFGKVTKEFWWGLEHLFQLTSYRQYELRIDLEAFDGSRAYAVYQQFRISSEEDGYTLSASDYTGNATDGLKYAVDSKFSTRDRGQDWSGVHCAQQRQGAWWYDSGCGYSNLNGPYRDEGIRDLRGIWWWDWRKYESLKKTVMKIRPT